MCPWQAASMREEKFYKKERQMYEDYAQINNWSGKPEFLLKELDRFEQSGLFDKALQMLKLGPETKMLEVGGGRGFPSNLFNKYAREVHLADQNESDVVGLGAAERLSALTGRKLRTQKAYFDALPYPDATFDAVFAKSCLHHSDEFNATFAEISRVLKPGGVFVFVEPCRGEYISEDFTMRNFFNMPGIKRDMNEHAPRLSDWKNWLGSNGFVLRSVYPTYFFAYCDLLIKVGFALAANIVRRLLIPFAYPYLWHAERFGQPPILPHPFTLGVCGFEYYEVLICAYKKK